MYDLNLPPRVLSVLASQHVLTLIPLFDRMSSARADFFWIARAEVADSSFGIDSSISFVEAMVSVSSLCESDNGGRKLSRLVGFIYEDMATALQSSRARR